MPADVPVPLGEVSIWPVGIPHVWRAWFAGSRGRPITTVASISLSSWLSGMPEPDLLARGAADGDDRLADAARLVGRELHAERVGVDDRARHAAPRDADGHRAEAGHLDRDVDARSQTTARSRTRRASRGRPAQCARTSIRPAGTSSCSVVTGSTIGDQPGLEQHRRHDHQVRPRHRREERRLLHDHEARVRARVGRREEHVDARARVAARLAQHQQAEPVAVLLEVLHLLEHRRAGRREPADAADDHPAVLALGMGVDRIDRDSRLLDRQGHSAASMSAIGRFRWPAGRDGVVASASMGSEVVLYTLNTEARTPT